MNAPTGPSPTHDGMLVAFILHADPVVQFVVGMLVLGSIASWAIIFDKIRSLHQLRGAIGRVEALARNPHAARPDPAGLTKVLLAARDSEEMDEPGGGDLRTRRAAAMRNAYLNELRRRERGLSFLATLASTAPFIGLFGTVWGIMRSFSAIAASNDTSLAVVAPGIAEALFATAIGLAAAIPAVVAYNLVRAALQRCGHRLAAATALLARASAVTAGQPMR